MKSYEGVMELRVSCQSRSCTALETEAVDDYTRLKTVRRMSRSRSRNTLQKSDYVIQRDETEHSLEKSIVNYFYLSVLIPSDRVNDISVLSTPVILSLCLEIDAEIKRTFFECHTLNTTFPLTSFINRSSCIMN